MPLSHLADVAPPLQSLFALQHQLYLVLCLALKYLGLMMALLLCLGRPCHQLFSAVMALMGVVGSISQL